MMKSRWMVATMIMAWAMSVPVNAAIIGSVESSDVGDGLIKDVLTLTSDEGDIASVDIRIVSPAGHNQEAFGIVDTLFQDQNNVLPFINMSDPMQDTQFLFLRASVLVPPDITGRNQEDFNILDGLFAFANQAAPMVPLAQIVRSDTMGLTSVAGEVFTVNGFVGLVDPAAPGGARSVPFNGSFDGQNFIPETIPEPASLAMLAMGMLWTGRWGQRSSRRS